MTDQEALQLQKTYGIVSTNYNDMGRHHILWVALFEAD